MDSRIHLPAFSIILTLDILKIFFLLQIAELQFSDSKGSDLKWVEEFNIGNVIEGKILESKEFGVVVSFDKYNDVFGFITHYQCKFFNLSPSLM